MQVMVFQMVEQLQQMAMDSLQKVNGETQTVAVKVDNQAVYKDSLLNVARNAQDEKDRSHPGFKDIDGFTD